MAKKRKSPWSVFIAMGLAVILGSWLGTKTHIFGVTFFAIVDVIGTVFLNALTLVVVPLVSSSIITGISRLGNEGAFGRLGGKMFLFYFLTSLIAILIGLFFVNLIHPGNEQAAASLKSVTDCSALKESISSKGSHTFVQVLVSIIPSNILAAFSRGEMLGLIFFSILFGYSLSKVQGKGAETVHHFFKGIFEGMIQFTQIIMRALPLGVFCLVTKVFMTTGLKSLTSVSLFFVCVLLGLSCFMFIGLPLMLKFIARVSPVRHFKAMAPAIVTAFSTSSSSASLPITIDCVEKRAGVSNKVCSLVVPLGTSINMSGSALYECIAAIFIAQSYGIELSFSTQFLVVFMSLIASMGVAGVPSGSLVAIIIILKAVGLPMEGIGLFVAVDRLLDMCRTTVNVFSDSCCAVFVGKSEGEKEILKIDPDELEAMQ